MAEAADAKSSRPWLGIVSIRKVGMAETAAVPAGTPGPQPERIVAQLMDNAWTVGSECARLGTGRLISYQPGAAMLAYRLINPPAKAD